MLWFSISICLLFFCIFRFNKAFRTGIPLIDNLVMPLGYSFYSFKIIGYTIDVYKNKAPAEKSFWHYLLMVSFFTEAVAGPIDRGDRLLREIKRPHEFQVENIRKGAEQVLIGFFKKLVVADTFALGIDKVYANVTNYSGLVLVLTVFLYAFQVYCDFSGYSDIAIGMAKMLDISIPSNFSVPYLAVSVKDFWRRWHISLSTWFRDYVYIPLGGSRTSKFKTYRNLLVTFLISGLWHGGNYTFLLWGLLHGTAQVIEKALNTVNPKCNQRFKPLRIILTFIFICLTWVFFRAATLGDALYVLTHLFSNISNPSLYVETFISSLYITWKGIAIIVFEIIAIVVLDYLQEKHNGIFNLVEQKPLLRIIVFIILLCLIIGISPKGTSGQFIYAQF